jgi:RimJ/RimL family protein N-acetyltransferase
VNKCEYKQLCHLAQEAFMNPVIETNRLILRELSLDDTAALAQILSDQDSMRFYPRVFSNEEVVNWIEWNLNNYRLYGHGLWAVILKDNEMCIGDCGITLQDIEGKQLPELGYHIN